MDELSFRGIKFWVSKYVPKTITLDIRKRNGDIVILERDADICLVDHNGYVAYPDKYYSYLWVRECLSRNAKVDESSFLVAELRKQLPAASQPAATPSSSYAPAVRDPTPGSYAATQLVKGRKLGRTPFTNEDDQILIDWLRTEGCLVDGSKNGLSGNEVYKRLEAKYPHHTYHSWRDRWVKKLSRVVSLETMAGHGNVAAPERAPSSLVARNSRTVPPARARAHQPPVHDIGGDERIPFLTTMDLAILRATWREALAGEQKTPAAFFEALAAKNPSVPVESWRARYMRLRAWYAKIDVFDQEEDRPSRQPAPDPQPAPTMNVASRDYQATGTSRRRGDGNGNRNGDDADNDDADDDDDEGGYDDTSFDAAALLNEVSAQDEAERRFYGDVDFFNSMGGGYYIPRAFIIGGRLLDIWTLWTAVQEVAPDPDSRDWDRVVETLNFDTARHPAIRQELEFWYSHNMADLEEARADFEADEADDAPHTQTQLSTGAKRRLHDAFVEDDSGADDSSADKAAATGSVNKRSRASEIPPPSDDDDSSYQLHPFVPAAAAAAAAAIEPETQDFAYGRATHSEEEDDADDADEDEDASSADLGVPVTPSQQLQTEVQTMEAFPLSLSLGRRSSLGPSSETGRWSASAPQADSRRSLPAWFGRGRVPESQTMPSLEEAGSPQR